MGAVARNALKGYVYQNYIFTLFLSKMDTDRSITRIESESITTAQFDDLYIENNKIKYRVQVKNYKGTTIEDIKVSDRIFTIGTNQNKYNPEDNNVVVINTSSIETNIKFMGLDAVEIDGITVIPLTESKVEELLDNMFSTESRELQIIHFGYKLISNSKFDVSLEDFPEIIRLSTDLEHSTVLLREPIEVLKSGITYIVGKPGVGKSHYVNELINKYREALVYRFWISSQDENLVNRLSFDKFLDDLALAVFKSPKKYVHNDLISEINNNELMIIIDGLDHVENYNPTELHKYINFIEQIDDAKVIVLSRPLKTEISWNKTELENWTYEETALYLAAAYDIHEHEVIHDIYTASNGYPIITYFLVEDYKLHGKINLDCQIESIEQYYELLLKQVNIKSALTLFATNNSFFLEREIELLLDNCEMSQMVREFIASYPYLFKRVANRISLIHDSFNTYLRKQLEFYPYRRKTVTQKVKNSIFASEARYMYRMTSFDFDEEFYDELLLKYCEFSELEKLFDKTLDYNSITSFYNQLQRLLETRTNIFNIYQYYSFVLIHQIVNRNDLKGFEGLIYQILTYINNHGNIEEEIYSIGTIWNVYVLLQDENEHKKYIDNRLSPLKRAYEVYKNVDEELDYFERLSLKIDFEKLSAILSGTEAHQMQKRDLIVKYLVSCWINNEKNEWYDILKMYLEEDRIKASKRLYSLALPYNIEEMWLDGIFIKAEYQLHELGYFKEKNIFNNITLKKLIDIQAPDGSFQTADYVKSYIRKCNHEKSEIDIFSVNYVWAMYYMRKDYSVITIGDALQVFEKNNLIDEIHSLEIIKRVMAQSEKGISGIMADYINNKPIEFTKKLIGLDYFNEDSPVNIFDLSPERISLFDERVIIANLKSIIKYHMYSKTIEYRYIDNLLQSSFADEVMGVLGYWEFSILGNIGEENILNKLNTYGIRCIGEKNHEESEYVPFEYGCIHQEDKEYIVENNIHYLEIARYTDGWHNCMPYINMYSLYEQDLIRDNYLEIVHNSIFARTFELQYIGNWDLLLGNIPSFLEQIDVDVEWNVLFNIFKCFLRMSMIYFGE